MVKISSVVDHTIYFGKRYGFISPPLDTPRFVSSWKTDNTSAGSSTSTQVKLPLESVGTYNFNVDWGDSSNDDITTWDQAEVTHTYASAGTYTIIIRDTCVGWRFANTGDRLKLLDISRWGKNFKLGNSGNYFQGVENLAITAVDAPNLSGTTTLQIMFFGATGFNSNIEHWDVSGVTNMRNMFQIASLFDQPLGAWDVSSVTDMSNMFHEAIKFNQPLGAWDMGAVITTRRMFRKATSFDQPLGVWDVSSVTDMGSMFEIATVFNQNLGGWDIINVTTMVLMFVGSALSTPNYDSLLTGWEAQAVQNNVSFNGGSSTYSAGDPATARANLIADHTWTIVDGGEV